MKQKILGLVAALVCLGGPALAQGGASNIQSVLSRAPLAAFQDGGGTIVAGYGNGDAIRWIAVRGAQAGRNPNTPNRFAAERSASPNQADVIAAVPDEDLRRATGLATRDWVNTWEVAQGPIRMGAMDIFPDSEMRLRGALFSSGYTEDQRAIGPILWRGETDYVPQDDWIEPANPFGGAEGLPLRVAFVGDRAVWATGWEALGHALSPGNPSLMVRPDAVATVAGLRRAGNLGGVVSVRMWLRNGGTLPITNAEEGPVEALALADFANRENEAAAMVLLFAEGTDVEAMATRIGDAFPILSDVPAPATPEISSGEGSITITLRSNWGEDGAATNAGYQTFLSMLDGGRLGFLLNR